MLATEINVSPDSDYYIYQPTSLARRLFFYPLVVGRFTYTEAYTLERKGFENYLLTYVEEGSCIVKRGSREFLAEAGSFFFLDCREFHGYRSAGSDGYRSLWLHFDGSTCKDFFHTIQQGLGTVFTLRPNLQQALVKGLNEIYATFRSQTVIQEARFSLQIASMLTLLANSLSGAAKGWPFLVDTGCDAYAPSGVQRAVSYIAEHYAEPLKLPLLAERALVSTSHFIRLFTQEMGVTPYQYLITTRLAAAKWLLLTTRQSVKEISFQTGFNDENAFCICFKKHEGLSPSSYRKQQKE